MAIEAQAPPKPEVVPLVKGIVDDVGDLIQQQLKFAAAEVRTDLKKTRDVALLFVFGAVLALPGLVLLAMALSHLLHWLTSPPGTDLAKVPLWACHAIVAGLILATSAVLVWGAKKKLDSFNPLPDETAQTVKENLEWIKSSK